MIDVERSETGGAAVLSLARPPVNALDLELIQSLTSTFEQTLAEQAPAIVLTGTGRCFSAGIDIVRIDGVPVRIYSVEKTIADCFKYRNKIGLDLAIEALRAFKQRRRRDMQALTKFARIDPAVPRYGADALPRLAATWGLHRPASGENLTRSD